VLFDLDRATLRPEAAKRLQGVFRQVKEYPNARIVVEGHTCSLGSARHNQRLSQARAEAIRRFLTKEAAVTASTVECRGYGETRPAAPNTSEEGRRRNRRVEVVFYALQPPASKIEAEESAHAGP
jgi:outer membrane protein OmpA-like peptidoglycan-associated protein